MVDVEAVRGLARQVAGLSGQVRAVGARARGADGVDWVSVAAERWRGELAGHAGHVDATAQALDDAVVALHRHADAVQERLAQVRAAQQAFDDLLGRARSTLARAQDAADDAAVAAAQRVVDAAQRAPGPGSLDWPSFLRDRA